MKSIKINNRISVIIKTYTTIDNKPIEEEEIEEIVEVEEAEEIEVVEEILKRIMIILTINLEMKYHLR